MFNSSRWWINIVFIKDGIHTLTNVVITDPTWTDLLSQSCATQAKERSYRNLCPIDQILPLVIEVFGFLHKHANVFLHDCANAIWSLKGTKGPHLSTLVTFLCQKVSITLERMQVSSIWSQVVVVGLTTSWLPPIQDTPPITMVDLLQDTDFWHINMANLP